MSNLPLAGITVVSIEQAVAAPFATRQLADLGARVIKVERPGSGDFARNYDKTAKGQASYFVWLNRSKESLTLDFKQPEGRKVLGQLLDEADVFVQNLGPGAAKRLGLDRASLAETNPRLITCDVSGYGNEGPWSHKKAYDMLIQCETGVMSLTGPPEGPARVGISVADIAAGMYAYTGILTSIIQRGQTGVGTAVEVSLFEALAEWMGQPAAYTQYTNVAPKRAGAEHATIAPYGPFEASDATVVLAVQNHREWEGLCDIVLGDAALAADPRFADNPARVENRAELNVIINERFATMTAAEAMALLDEARIANAQLRTTQEFLEHPSLTGRNRWRKVDSPGGEIDALLPPANIDGIEPVMNPIPAVGEHTDAILAELGYSGDDIAALHSADTV